MADDAVLVERLGHIMVVTLNRPEAHNAVNSTVSRLVGGALEQAQHDDSIWVVIIAGSGPTFCAGADLKALRAGERIDAPGRESWGFAGFMRHHISKPTISAVGGAALGGGMEIALASDLVVAARNASFGLPEVRRGLIAGAGGAFRLPRQIPGKIAMELLLTGRSLSAEQAHRLGLVNVLAEERQALPRAIELAEQIAGNAPLAVQASKRVARSIVGGRIEDEDSAWALSDAELSTLRGTRDMREGISAFAERREPVWTAT
ncbi:MAG TPA: crotonase/enoyl-CoA hydratase family protein [Jatrophihabitantaceae bacterium]|nr:crotonase/enoyl-CoA hydratase family protein [Jatrophihabitantaceae bacterium]